MNLSMISKGFAVANFFFALVFLGYAVMAVGTRFDLNKELTDARAEQRKYEDRRGELEKINSKFDETLKGEKARFAKESEERKKGLDGQQSEIEERSTEQRRVQQQQDKLLDEVKSAHAEQKERREEVEKLRADRANQESNLTKLSDEKSSLANRFAQLSNIAGTLTARLQDISDRLKQLEAGAKSR